MGGRVPRCAEGGPGVLRSQLGSELATLQAVLDSRSQEMLDRVKEVRPPPDPLGSLW